jgi:hypothetical protein
MSLSDAGQRLLMLDGRVTSDVQEFIRKFDVDVIFTPLHDGQRGFKSEMKRTERLGKIEAAKRRRRGKTSIDPSKISPASVDPSWRDEFSRKNQARVSTILSNYHEREFKFEYFQGQLDVEDIFIHNWHPSVVDLLPSWLRREFEPVHWTINKPSTLTFILMKMFAGLNVDYCLPPVVGMTKVECKDMMGKGYCSCPGHNIENPYLQYLKWFAAKYSFNEEGRDAIHAFPSIVVLICISSALLAFEVGQGYNADLKDRQGVIKLRCLMLASLHEVFLYIVSDPHARTSSLKSMMSVPLHFRFYASSKGAKLVWSVDDMTSPSPTINGASVRVSDRFQNDDETLSVFMPKIKSNLDELSKAGLPSLSRLLSYMISAPFTHDNHSLFSFVKHLGSLSGYTSTISGRSFLKQMRNSNKFDASSEFANLPQHVYNVTTSILEDVVAHSKTGTLLPPILDYVRAIPSVLTNRASGFTRVPPIEFTVPRSFFGKKGSIKMQDRIRLKTATKLARFYGDLKSSLGFRAGNVYNNLGSRRVTSGRSKRAVFIIPLDRFIWEMYFMRGIGAYVSGFDRNGPMIAGRNMFATGKTTGTFADAVPQCALSSYEEDGVMEYYTVCLDNTNFDAHLRPENVKVAFASAIQTILRRHGELEQSLADGAEYCPFSKVKEIFERIITQFKQFYRVNLDGTDVTEPYEALESGSAFTSFMGSVTSVSLVRSINDALRKEGGDISMMELVSCRVLGDDILAVWRVPKGLMRPSVVSRVVEIIESVAAVNGFSLSADKSEMSSRTGCTFLKVSSRGGVNEQNYELQMFCQERKMKVADVEQLLGGLVSKVRLAATRFYQHTDMLELVVRMYAHQAAYQSYEDPAFKTRIYLRPLTAFLPFSKGGVGLMPDIRMPANPLLILALSQFNPDLKIALDNASTVGSRNRQRLTQITKLILSGKDVEVVVGGLTRRGMHPFKDGLTFMSDQLQREKIVMSRRAYDLIRERRAFFPRELLYEQTPNRVIEQILEPIIAAPARVFASRSRAVGVLRSLDDVTHDLFDDFPILKHMSFIPGEEMPYHDIYAGVPVDEAVFPMSSTPWYMYYYFGIAGVDASAIRDVLPMIQELYRAGLPRHITEDSLLRMLGAPDIRKDHELIASFLIAMGVSSEAAISASIRMKQLFSDKLILDSVAYGAASDVYISSFDSSYRNVTAGIEWGFGLLGNPGHIRKYIELVAHQFSMMLCFLTKKRYKIHIKWRSPKSPGLFLVDLGVITYDQMSRSWYGFVDA